MKKIIIVFLVGVMYCNLFGAGERDGGIPASPFAASASSGPPSFGELFFEEMGAFLDDFQDVTHLVVGSTSAVLEQAPNELQRELDTLRLELREAQEALEAERQARALLHEAFRTKEVEFFHKVRAQQEWIERARVIFQAGGQARAAHQKEAFQAADREIARLQLTLVATQEALEAERQARSLQEEAFREKEAEILHKDRLLRERQAELDTLRSGLQGSQEALEAERQAKALQDEKLNLAQKDVERLEMALQEAQKKLEQQRNSLEIGTRTIEALRSENDHLRAELGAARGVNHEWDFLSQQNALLQGQLMQVSHYNSLYLKKIKELEDALVRSEHHATLKRQEVEAFINNIRAAEERAKQAEHRENGVLQIQRNVERQLQEAREQLPRAKAELQANERKRKAELERLKKAECREREILLRQKGAAEERAKQTEYQLQEAREQLASVEDELQRLRALEKRIPVVELRVAQGNAAQKRPDGDKTEFGQPSQRRRVAEGQTMNKIVE
jgi:DNA repair exonuclease SbcCD ATPase subunit